MSAGILSRHRQRFLGNIDRHNVSVRQVDRAGYGNTSAAGTQIQQLSDLARFLPRRESGLDQLGNRRSGDEYTLIDAKPETAEPRFPNEIRCRYSLLDSTTEKLLYRILFRRCKTRM